MFLRQELVEHAAQCEHIASVRHFVIIHLNLFIVDGIEQFGCQVDFCADYTAGDGIDSALTLLTQTEI